MKQQGRKRAGKYDESGLPVPGSSQLKSFGTWQMTDDICMQTQPWPSTIDVRDWMIKMGSSQSVTFNKRKKGFLDDLCNLLGNPFYQLFPHVQECYRQNPKYTWEWRKMWRKKMDKKAPYIWWKKKWIRKHLKFESSFETACKESSKGCDNWCK